MKISTPAHTIASVERDTGLSKDLLRKWEQRYGFPMPARDAQGERVYADEQVARLRLIKRLIDQGRRPGSLMGCSAAELSELLGAVPASPDEVAPPELGARLLQLLKRHSAAELRAMLQQSLLRQGLQDFVQSVVAPLNVAVGEAWLRGEIEIAEEHLYTEQVQNILRAAIGMHPPGNTSPQVLLTTFPEELHGLGLLMVEAMLVAEGASCISLGTQTPVGDIALIADGGRFDVVALSFSAAYPLRQAIDGISRLRTMLPPERALWCGGGGIRGRSFDLAGVRILNGLGETAEALREWRAAASQ